MFARVSRYKSDEDSEKLLEGFQATVGPLQLVDGFSHAYFMVDRETGMEGHPSTVHVHAVLGVVFPVRLESE